MVLVAKTMGRTEYVKTTCCVILGILMSVLPANVILAEEGADPLPCCEVDKPEDAPTESAAAWLRARNAKEMAPAPNVKKFKTDSAPELDWYQPCSGGDNLIHFNINVHDVDVSSLKSAKLTLAVWDVDYHCSLWCCERDSVYLNGHRLTTPVQYLTGANNQWSTVTFNVDPSWVVDGGNYVQIFIDLFCPGYWCVTCDWGELALELGDTPEIEDIEISPTNPETTKDVTFNAKIKSVAGYEVVKVGWAGDVDSGEGNPYKVKPAAGTHGKDKNIIATLTYKKTATGATGTHTRSEKFKLFFVKKGDEDGDGKPNWFEHWKTDGAVPNMGSAKYDSTSSAYGYMTSGGDLYLTPHSADQHYSSAIVLTTHFGTESFGGPTVKGIDCAAEIVAHELYHKWVNDQWKTGGSFNGKTDSDNGVPTADCRDKLPDFYETATSHTKNDDCDTYDLEHKKSSTYRRYGDNEYMAMRTGNGARGTNSKDWANPGKQSNPAYGSTGLTRLGLVMLRSGIIEAQGPSLPVQASFTGNNSDQGVDTDLDGKYDLLRVLAGVNVVNGGVFKVVAFLKDKNDNVITFVNIALTLAAGLQDITLDFEGTAIWTHGVDGPYTVDIALDDEYGNGIDTEQHTTQPYAYTDFDRTGSSIIGNYAESLPDLNTNGLADALDIAVDVDVINAGDLTIEGYLHAPDGTPITYAKTTQSIGAGPQTLHLSFDGIKIRQSHTDGPYKLRSAAVYEGSERTDFVYDAYETSAHSCTIFERTVAEYGAGDTFNDLGVDLDGDGLFDVLQIDLNVDVLQAGQYAVVAHLADTEGNPIDDATLGLDLAAGQQTFSLDFSGTAIWLNQKDGPYKLRYAFLYDSSGSLADALWPPYTTSAYDYTEFQRPPVALTGNYSDYGTDTDSDGVYDYLTVEVEAIVANTGNYALNARLMDYAEHEIVWASTTAWLPADQMRIVKLNFDGDAIYNHGANGPYYVRDVYLYNMANTTQSDYVYEAYTTSAYTCGQFGNLPPVADAGGPYKGVIGKPVVFDASGSYDPDGVIVLYEWDWDDDGTFDYSTTNPIGEHTWYVEFSGMVNLRVTDGDGLSATDAATVVIVGPGIDTLSAKNVGLTSAKLCGQVTEDAGEACQYRFRYCKEGDAESFTPWSSDLKATGESFSQDVSGLTPSSHYYFSAHIRNSAGERVGDLKSFTTLGSLLQLEAPNGGGSYLAGSRCLICWKADPALGDSSVLIEYSADNGSSWNTIQTVANGDAWRSYIGGDYLWQAPAVTSSECLVRISDTSDPSIFDVSDSTFSILMQAVPGVVGLGQADAEAAITAASLVVGTITYVYDNVVAAGEVIGQHPAAGTPVLVNSAVELVVSAGPTAAGPPSVDTEYAVNIGASSAGLRGEVTDDGGGCCQYRFWYHEEGSDDYRVTPWSSEFKTTGESFSQDIDGLTPGRKYHFWAQVKNSEGESDRWAPSESFTTLEGLLQLEGPNGGTFPAGSRCLICWKADAVVSKVLVECSTDDGGSWSVIGTVSNGDAWRSCRGGYCSWYPPAVSSDECLIRISDTSDPSVFDVSESTFSIVP